MSDNLVQCQVWAVAKIVAGGAITVQRGCTVLNTGAGVHTVTLDREIDASEQICLVTAMGGTDRTVECEDTSDAVKTIRTYNAAGAAADVAFSFLMLRVAP